MDLNSTKFKALLAVLLTGAINLSADAQQSGQPIIFSSPQAAGTPSGIPSLTSDNSRLEVLPGTLQAPAQIFNFTPPNDILPAPVPLVDFQQQRRMKKMLEERKNWAFMSPEEILNTSTLEKSSQSPELDAFGREKNQTPLEHYLERQSRLQAGATNGWPNDRADSPWDFSPDSDNANALNPNRSSSMEIVRRYSQFINGQQNPMAVQNGNSDWVAFSQSFPKTTTKPDLEQVAALERFRQLLNPNSSTTTQPSPDSQFFPVAKPAADPFMIHPEFILNPAGAPIMTLSSALTKPAGLTPLPGLAASFALPATVPVGKLQPAPWLLQGPQPFVMPQRKF